eukprot:4610077-Pyramimonas_sp.AAC.1
MNLDNFERARGVSALALSLSAPSCRMHMAPREICKATPDTPRRRRVLETVGRALPRSVVGYQPPRDEGEGAQWAWGGLRGRGAAPVSEHELVYVRGHSICSGSGVAGCSGIHLPMGSLSESALPSAFRGISSLKPCSKLCDVSRRLMVVLAM